ncbi:hypothetical protein QYE76_055202 [Lolium multiflorum]|uniref:Transposase-associated domain-containing protein n=1 Tax=Lolium multiflorum TaxID=4521 RepID=A0AAD8WNR1_LOLMU|nr:hypothetical protein QYE76_055202 [Lolium multiflorum]
MAKQSSEMDVLVPDGHACNYIRAAPLLCRKACPVPSVPRAKSGSQKLRHYFQEHPMAVVSKTPLSTIINNSDATGRVAKWGIKLSAFDINYKARSSIKSQVLADIFVDWTEAPEGTQAWVMHFDGSKQHQGSGAGVTMKSPTGEDLQYVLQIHFEATNNMAEYEALLPMSHPWMYGNRCAPAFREGVNSFLLVAEANKSKQGFMCCPCLKCKNEKDYSCSRDIKSHLLRFGFMSSYNVWTKHGEEGVMMEDGDEEEDNDDQYRSMFSECDDTAMEDNEEEGGEEHAADDPVDDDLRRAISDARRDCGTDKERLQFDKMLEDHHKLLYPEILQRKYSQLDEINAQDLIFPGSFQSREAPEGSHGAPPHKAARPGGALWCGTTTPPRLPFRL